jgi:hypothetical protein
VQGRYDIYPDSMQEGVFASKEFRYPEGVRQVMEKELQSDFFEYARTSFVGGQWEPAGLANPPYTDRAYFPANRDTYFPLPEYHLSMGSERSGTATSTACSKTTPLIYLFPTFTSRCSSHLFTSPKTTGRRRSWWVLTRRRTIRRACRRSLKKFDVRV